MPYLLAVPSLVATSDFLAAVPDELADLFSRLADVDVFPLPIKLPDLSVQQFWHARHHNDVGHRWCRRLDKAEVESQKLSFKQRGEANAHPLLASSF